MKHAILLTKRTGESKIYTGCGWVSIIDAKPHTARCWKNREDARRELNYIRENQTSSFDLEIISGSRSQILIRAANSSAGTNPEEQKGI